MFLHYRNAKDNLSYLRNGTAIWYNAAMKAGLRNIIIFRRTNEASDMRFLSAALGQSQICGNWRIRIVTETEALRRLCDNANADMPDGIITTETETPEIEAALDASRIPTVVVGTHNSKLPTRTRAVSYVTIDEIRVGEAAAEYLGVLGRFNSYAFVHASKPHMRRWSSLRCEGFVAALKRKGLHTRIFDGGDLSSFLKELPKPAAVLAACDIFAAEVVDTCDASNLPVPSQVSVVGIDNDESVCLTTLPRISSIAINSSSEGLEAVSELHRLMSAPHKFRKPRTRTCPGALNVIERGTTSQLKPAARLIDAANAFISANVGSPIKVPDVVAACWTSRRLLEMRFRELLGEGVAHYILRTRMEHLAARLLASNAPAARICRQFGFRNVPHASAAFRRLYGMSMGEYRAKAAGERP